MKARELMIGDWVNEVMVGIYQWDIADYPDFDERYVKPIPLTQEILEKNGWKLDEYDNGWFNNNAPMLNGIDCSNLSMFGEYNIPIHYVHELQHALRLCGLNELADSFKI